MASSRATALLPLLLCSSVLILCSSTRVSRSALFAPFALGRFDWAGAAPFAPPHRLSPALRCSATHSFALFESCMSEAAEYAAPLVCDDRCEQLTSALRGDVTASVARLRPARVSDALRSASSAVVLQPSSIPLPHHEPIASSRERDSVTMSAGGGIRATGTGWK